VCAVFSACSFYMASSFALLSWSEICEGSAVREFPLSFAMWWSSWSALVGVFFLDLFYEGIVNCFSAETMVGTNVEGPKIGWSPRTQDYEANTRKSRRDWGQRIPKSLYSPQKLSIPLHVTSRPLL
jgi:hypothetical protein